MGNHSCSALTQWLKLIEGKKVNAHKASRAKVGGQLPFLGLTGLDCAMKNRITGAATIQAIYLLAAAMLLLLSACGFQLRGANGSAALPFQTVYLSFPETSALGNELKRYIHASGTTSVSTDAISAQATIELLSESREKIILSRNAQGREREHSLFYKVRLRVKDKQNNELMPATEIVLKRDISFNEGQVIAKEKEEDLLYRDMRNDMVQQILRRLAALNKS